MKPRSLLAAALLSPLTLGSAFAGSATWNAPPTSSDWNTPGDWTPATVPDGPADVATFDVSNNPAVTLSASAEVSGLVFNVGAMSYTISPKHGSDLTLSGFGIQNDSGQKQSFFTSVDNAGRLAQIIFSNHASAGTETAFFNQGGGFPGAETDFLDTSTADHGTFTNFGGSNPDTGAQTQFFDSSTAGNSVISNLAGLGIFGGGGHTMFFDVATAGEAVITNAGGLGPFIFPATMFFNDRSSAGQSTITSNGADALYATGSVVTFEGRSSAGNATVIANGGGYSGATTMFMGESSAGHATLVANGTASQSSGGLISFLESSSGEMARVKVLGNGTLDIGSANTRSLTIGSLEGDGLVHLGASQLLIGSNHQSATFGGAIDGPGSLTKIGQGKLILTSSNAYSGGTSIKGGAVLVTNRAGSATGSGFVRVNRGVLGGSGRIGGPVTVGDGASLSPGPDGANPAELFLQRSLTFSSLGAYRVTLNSTTPAANEVVANGVTIESGATVFLRDIGARTIATGAIFTILSNTSANPIGGTFANLADGSTLNLNGNNFVVSYEGGDGNDLTLTVQ